ncbi:MAG: 4-hydroxy-3-methylbut-2-enyl diphosphate reductase [Bacteroidales bacterium]|nr:4-hydroxy-3-methylbut-2-enyl diphosphate reductase [Bacteroidales bacterium]MCF8391137.1 4-hydroxy-3-methylbut-2-enyl diphosphate reductase [Bacteroidales bacterium]
MKVEIEKGSGFCFGVRKVIQMAEEILDKGENLYCLGEIVHNEEEINRLLEKGMVFINDEDLLTLKDETVLIRAHGEPPSTYKICEERNITIIDGTCPIVNALQKKIRKSYNQSDTLTDQIVIYGKDTHPEVKALNGQIDNSAIIIRNAKDLEKINPEKNTILFSQTTMDSEGFVDLGNKIKLNSMSFPDVNVEIKNTICKHISHRQPGIVDFARSHDILIFVAGRNSSNGKILFDICKKENDNSKFISEVDQLKKEWFSSVKNVGIAGATSTPAWVLKLVKERIESFKII